MPGLARTEISAPLEPKDTAGEKHGIADDSARDPLRFLFATAETHPTHRADVRVLFGKYLPTFGVQTDLLAVSLASADTPPWRGGRTLIWRARTRIGQLIADIVQQLTLFRRCLRGYDGLIVRDKPLLSLIGLAAARIARIPFVYWMSFPLPEVYLEISRDPTVGCPRRIYAWVRGRVGSWTLHRLVAPRADHLFVQSALMLEELIAGGLVHRRATPVPMGVDMEEMPESSGLPEALSDRRGNRRTAVYLGTLSRLRRPELELMVDAAKIVGQCYPDFVLLVIGESETSEEKGWLARYAEACGAAPWLRFTGWVPYDQGIQLASSCAVGLSPFPRGQLFDSASPTKAIEYLALGLPAVCNDQPEQKRVIEESGGGLCVDLTAESFAAAILQLLTSPESARSMGRMGRSWVSGHRDYRHLARIVADTLRSLHDDRKNGRSNRLQIQPHELT